MVLRQYTEMKRLREDVDGDYDKFCLIVYTIGELKVVNLTEIDANYPCTMF